MIEISSLKVNRLIDMVGKLQQIDRAEPSSECPLKLLALSLIPQPDDKSPSRIGKRCQSRDLGFTQPRDIAKYDTVISAEFDLR